MAKREMKSKATPKTRASSVKPKKEFNAFTEEEFFAVPEVTSEPERVMDDDARAYLIEEMGKEWFKNNKFCCGVITLEKAKEIVAYFRKSEKASKS